MSPPKLCIVRTGTANLASITCGLHRAGVETHISHDPQEIRQAKLVMLPGVGSFGAAMDELRKQDLIAALQERFSQEKATMAICVGLQLLCRESEESPGVEGLAVIDAKIKRFQGDIRIPHMGWNSVQSLDGCQLLSNGYAYYANSFRLDDIPEGWTGALSDHGGSFVAAIEKGPLLACQFHPELSGSWGQALLRAWIKRGSSC